MATRREWAFQSPVYRGGCCNGTWTPSCSHRSTPCFNPLFIGADAVTQALGFDPTRCYRAFQSPVYRGGCCNKGGRLSSPSRTRRFQSPVYRGGCCNRGDDGLPAGASGSFNPLFIGADAVTQGGKFCCGREPQRVSIPCLSGRML